jgi:FkbM family methyltransferase
VPSLHSRRRRFRAGTSPEPTDGRLRLEEFGLDLFPEQAYFVDGLEAARALRAEGARFRHDEAGRLLCEVGGVRAFVRDGEELEILREIFAERTYEIVPPGPAVIWDIGMNVGLASLYFAARGNTRVVGYEPIGSTYLLARENLDLNPGLSGAITAVNCGIGGWERTAEVDYCPGRKGSVGLRGAVSDPAVRRLVFHLPVDIPVWKEPLPMADAVSVLRSIRAAHGNLPIVAKIDCEGAEYEIVEALHGSDELASLHALAIEWHADGPGELQRWLVDSGFTVLAPGRSRGLWGKIYAVRASYG